MNFLRKRAGDACVYISSLTELADFNHEVRDMNDCIHSRNLFPCLAIYLLTCQPACLPTHSVLWCYVQYFTVQYNTLNKTTTLERIVHVIETVRTLTPILLIILCYCIAPDTGLHCPTLHYTTPYHTTLYCIALYCRWTCRTI